MKFRLDEYLVQQSYFNSRSQASRAIKSEEVSVNGKIVKKTGFLVSDQDEISLLNSNYYVSRGGLKLKAAIDSFKINVTNSVVADFGASTGGFTDYVLQHGASKVYAIDVGHGQLVEKLRHDKRVINLEGVNIRYGVDLPERVDLGVVDLSFISLRLCLPVIWNLLKKTSKLIVLFKPQFEAGKGVVNKQGVIKNEKERQKILDAFLSWCTEEGYLFKQWIESPIKGQKGNVEYLIYFEVV